jgi:2-oxoglutarate dehydrogenase E1 component
MTELEKGSFQFVIDDPEPGLKSESVKTLCFCSGRLYYDIAARRSEMKVKDTAIVRLEQLYPFPAQEIRGILDRYAHIQRTCWTQEESANRGAWLFFKEQMEHIGIRDIEYIGREKSASPATGSHRRHLQEQEAILTALFKQSTAVKGPLKKRTQKGVTTRK